MEPVDRLMELYKKAEEMDYIGEPVSQLAHMQQTAFLARDSGADDELVLAAFFHDIGHICASQNADQMDGLGVLNHEFIGESYLLEMGFSKRVGRLVALHVQAKRYLCWKNARYHRNLSEASKGTLDFQGGPMTEREAKEFEISPYFRDILRLRTWDERAKEMDGDGIDLSTIRYIATKHLEEQNQCR